VERLLITVLLAVLMLVMSAPVAWACTRRKRRLGNCKSWGVGRMYGV
jgi:hypothetical protein